MFAEPADPEEASRSLQGPATVQANPMTDTAEARLSNAAIALDVTPPNVSVTDIQLAIQNTFGETAMPVAITPFRSDFIIQFATADERDTVVSSRVLYGQNFSALLICWYRNYGGQTINWNTELAIDIHGFPPHTFHPNTLSSLLERHCSIQGHTFNDSTGACRVDAYAASRTSIPPSGLVGLQYPNQHGVTNIVFPVTMTAYNHSEALPFLQNGNSANANHSATHSAAISLDSAAEAGVERELYDEAMDWQHRANKRIARGRYRGFATYSQSSASTASSEDLEQAIAGVQRARYHEHASDSATSAFGYSSDESFYLPRDYSGCSLQSDRTRHLD